MPIGPSYYHQEAHTKHPGLSVSFIYSWCLLLLGLDKFVYISVFSNEWS